MRHHSGSNVALRNHRRQTVETPRSAFPPLGSSGYENAFPPLGSGGYGRYSTKIFWERFLRAVTNLGCHRTTHLVGYLPGYASVNPTSREIQDLIQSHGAALVLYARQWCVCPDDALQEALIDLALLAERPRDPVAWLFKATRFKAMNMTRSERRRLRYQQQAAELRDWWFENDPADAVQSSELETMLSELEPLDREIVVARIWGSMSFEQIADLVDGSLSTVHRRYQHSLKQLQLKFNGQVEKR